MFMFEKLLSFLLHAKGGALATVLVLGASGALVTATVENGVTTVTITQPSPSPSGSSDPSASPDASPTTSTTTLTTTSPVILALFTRTKAEDDPTSPATGGNGCSDAAKAINEQVKRVNDAAKTDRETVKDLGKDLRSDAAKQAVKDAEKAIKEIRRAAVKAIHATSPACAKDDDEDVDEHDGDDNDNDEDNDEDEDASAAPAVAFSGADAKAIADLAISAMDLQVTNLKAVLATLPAAEPKTDDKADRVGSDRDKSGGNRSDRDKSDSNGSDNVKSGKLKPNFDMHDKMHDNQGKGGGDKGRQGRSG